LGWALFRRGRLDEAIAQCREALRLDPNIAETHNNLGQALALQGRRDEAIVEYREALRLDPHHDEARRLLDEALGTLPQGPHS
jgi:protein O-mannosyl-transferase